MQRLSGFVLVMALLAASLAACSVGGTRGSGNVKTETRQVSGFTGIEMSGAGELNVSQGPNDTLTIEADENILPLLTSEVRDGQLALGIKPGSSVQHWTKLVYTVTMRDLSSLAISGAGNINGSNINTNKLTVRVSGAGNLTLSGTAREQNVTLSGIGNYRGEGLNSEVATISVAGAGDAKVRVNQTLDAKISGAGSISYIGDPQVNQEVSGVGRVEKTTN